MDGINKAKDPKNMTDFENKHTPFIKIPQKTKAGESFEVEVGVGYDKVAHPNENGHYISWMAFYTDDYTFLGRVDLTPVKSSPKVKFNITLEKPTSIRAYAFCNLHGLWQGKKEVSL